MNRVEHLSEGVTLYLGDCQEILPTLPKASIVTDPPYGQDYKVNTFYAGGTRENAVVQRNGSTLIVSPTVYEPIIGDDKPFDPTHLLEHGAPELLIWGAHKFADRLPAGGWLVWDKVPTGKVRDQGDGEAAWINRDQPMRIFRLLWDGLSVGSGARHEVTAGQKRLHPSQKPEALMVWCLGFIKGDTIIDPYMGAGATGRACWQAFPRYRKGSELFRDRMPAHRERTGAASHVQRGCSGAAGSAETRGDALMKTIWPAVIAIFVTILIVLLVVLMAMRHAHAHDHARPDLTPWFKQLKSKQGFCCDGMDALHLRDVDWEVKDGHYRVRVPKSGDDLARAVAGEKIESFWADVPDDAVIDEPNKDGATLVWPLYGAEGVSIRCFLRGEMS